MALLLILITFFSVATSVQAHEANVKGHLEKDSRYISTCNDKFYGYHKQGGNNHWHEVVFKDGEWSIVDPSLIIADNPCNESIEKVEFEKCVDGDTVVLMINGKKTKIRFLAVDTPESVHPTKDVELYSKEASTNTCNLLKNATTIDVEYDSNSDQKDKYDRYLAWIWVDGNLLQEIMIREGFARVSYVYGNYKYLDKLCSLQYKAMEEKKGIWQYYDDMGYCLTHGNDNANFETKRLLSVTFSDASSKRETTVVEGMKVKELAASEKMGYDFIGWYNKDKLYDFKTPVSEDLVLEAKYKINYYFFIGLAIAILIVLLNNKKGKKYGKRNKKSIKYN